MNTNAKSYWPFWFHYQRPDIEIFLGNEVEILYDMLWQKIQPKLKESLKESLTRKYLNNQCYAQL